MNLSEPVNILSPTFAALFGELDPGTVAIVVAALGSLLAVFAKVKQGMFEVKTVNETEKIKAKISETEVLLTSWEIRSEVDAKAIEGLNRNLQEIKKDREAEREHRRTCEIKFAKVEGQLEVLLTVQQRQIVQYDKQDERYNNRIDREADAQTIRHEKQDIRQDSQDEEVLRISAEVAGIHNTQDAELLGKK